MTSKHWLIAIASPFLLSCGPSIATSFKAPERDLTREFADTLAGPVWASGARTFQFDQAIAFTGTFDSIVQHLVQEDNGSLLFTDDAHCVATWSGNYGYYEQPIDQSSETKKTLRLWNQTIVPTLSESGPMGSKDPEAICRAYYDSMYSGAHFEIKRLEKDRFEALEPWNLDFNAQDNYITSFDSTSSYLGGGEEVFVRKDEPLDITRESLKATVGNFTFDGDPRTHLILNAGNSTLTVNSPSCGFRYLFGITGVSVLNGKGRLHGTLTSEEETSQDCAALKDMLKSSLDAGVELGYYTSQGGFEPFCRLGVTVLMLNRPDGYGTKYFFQKSNCE